MPPVSEFNLAEYYTPYRRFILGSLVRYDVEGETIWAWEMAPSDNAGAESIAWAFGKISEACFCGKDLYFHPTSLAMEKAAEFQTPLSKVNILCHERGIPNLGLRGAATDSVLRSLEGSWAGLTVDSGGYSVRPATQAEAEADAWWEARTPPAVSLPEADTAIRDLRDLEAILVPDSMGLATALRKAASAFGGRAAHCSAFPRMNPAAVSYGKSFAIPVYCYRRHMLRNGLEDTLAGMLADSAFRTDPAERGRRLDALRARILAAPLDTVFLADLMAKLETAFPGAESFRFLPSGNAQNLEGFAAAGFYASRIADRGAVGTGIASAVRGFWAGLWDFRVFEEARLRKLDPLSLAMGVMVEENRPGAVAHGMALTVNPFDPHGFGPGFYIEAGPGGEESAAPGSVEGFVYQFTVTGQPIVMLSRPGGGSGAASALTAAQTYALGRALLETFSFIQPVYGKDPASWYAMEVDFEFARKTGDPPSAEPAVFLRQAGPYPGWGRW